MVLFFIGLIVFVAGIAWMWATGIDNHTKYKNENPNHDPNQGWLDWDCDKAHTEGGL